MRREDRTNLTLSEKPISLDAYAPSEIAHRVETVGVKKAQLDFWSMFALAVLAGAFISLGAAFATLVMTDTGLGYGVMRLLGGLVFSLGLILVIIAGAELFTGNNLIVMAWASRKVSAGALLSNWVIVYIGNLIGALGTVLLIYLTRYWSFANAKVGATALNIAFTKTNLDFMQALALGIMCNALVCLAVWLCFSARTTTDKILSIIYPITAFVAMGFEHSVANMYFIPMGVLLKQEPTVLSAANKAPEMLANLDWLGFINNLIPVTIGNIIGGGVLVAAIYWFVYLRKAQD